MCLWRVAWNASTILEIAILFQLVLPFLARQSFEVK